ncbi:MAG: hypothetical protein HY695_38405 [Deltaproteobacteria bacterium]|nr:hypothetical protein [Deltaproteobacteria bacterium]
MKLYTLEFEGVVRILDSGETKTLHGKVLFSRKESGWHGSLCQVWSMC